MRLSARFEPAYERVGPLASFRTSSSASFARLSGAVTRLIRPQSSACCAETRSPSRASWNARALPTAAGTNAVEPPSAIGPVEGDAADAVVDLPNDGFVAHRAPYSHRMLLEEVDWLGHAGFRVTVAGSTIYIDPYRISDDDPKADLVLITHQHYDHFSP